MDHNPNQPYIDRFWDLIEAGENIFLTGGGGTGKSYLTRQLIAANKDLVAVTASTGIAACNINGMTVFSWSGMGLGPGENDTDAGYYTKLYRNFNGALKNAAMRMGKKTMLVIDEISMLNGRVLNYLDYHLRQMRATDKPFGGMQVIVVGDFMQLPPVHKGTQTIDWAFNSRAWRDARFQMVDLKHVIRQQDGEFAQMLNGIRFGELSPGDSMKLQFKVLPAPGPEVCRIMTKNVDVDNWNDKQLMAMEGKMHRYVADVRGSSNQREKLIKNMITPQELILKVGAKVMATCNNMTEGYFNGSMGRVVDMREFEVDVDFEGIGVCTVEENEWSFDPDDPDTATFKQIPLKLAWAITAHKSQGATIQQAYVSIAECFEYGQAYVALSRCTTLDGLILASFNRSAIKHSEEAAAFYRNPAAYMNPGEPGKLLEKEETRLLGGSESYVPSI